MATLPAEVCVCGTALRTTPTAAAAAPLQTSNRRRPRLSRAAPPLPGAGRGRVGVWESQGRRRVRWRGDVRFSVAGRVARAGSFDPATTPPEEPDQIRERFRIRLFGELRQAAVKGGYDGSKFDRGVKLLETVVGTFTPDLSVLREAEWVEFIVDASSLASKMVILKTYFPGLDVTQLILRKPRVFLGDAKQLETTCQQVMHLLKDAPDAGAIISDTPDLLDPPMVASAIVTFQKWWPDKDPIKVLQDEGAYWLSFAQENEIPLEPVYYDGTSWTVPAFDTSAELPPWKHFIAEKAKREEARAKEEKGFIF